ncbi:MAG: LLM class F420-dependent oxidoreductase [Alphaproteobacteria bacterium]|nr:LLM class F420-dependent oxidoreductase [Alphaproteobacteria bacterium]
MYVGTTIPVRGPLANPADVRLLAEKTEALGFDHLAVTDHVVVPKTIDSRYPYSKSGAFPGSPSGACFDQFSLLAFLAAISTKPRLVTAITVIPHRGAVHTAKIVSTIDVLSGGRVVLGVGAGWMKEEFEALNLPPFEARGRVTDEYLDAFKILWTEDDPRYDGEHVQFANINFLPKPVQTPHPPIWVGGESPAALRRALRAGDVWFPIANNPRYPMDTAQRFKDGVERLHRAAEKQQRDPKSIGLALFANWYDETKTAKTDDGERQLLTGSAADIADDINALSGLGVTDLILQFQRDTLEQTLDSMHFFTSEVRPALG